MNMIIAGDGHTNIRAEDSLSAKAASWSVETSDCDIIVTNPPFGTSETDSLVKVDWDQFPHRLSKGQQLFLQKMVLSSRSGGDICTVIDDGLLNTASSRSLRKWVFEQCRVKAVVRLPDDTFKPNKINVRSSILLLEKREFADLDLDEDYCVPFIDLMSLGYYGSGETIRGFNFKTVLDDIETKALDRSLGALRKGEHWLAFDVKVSAFKADDSYRLDLKYWHPDIKAVIDLLDKKAAPTIQTLNAIKTRRGMSPKSESYVDEIDGFALVIKAGTSITKFGTVIAGDDYIEKDVFDEMQAVAIQKYDVLIASTGTGTLGKCGVYELDSPAIADGHVTIVRADPARIDPFYLADFLRAGGGAAQIDQLYTGSTGLIELTPEDVDRIKVDILGGDIKAQRKKSKALRDAESHYLSSISNAEDVIGKARSRFTED